MSIATPTGDFPDPLGYMWSDAIGWHRVGCGVCGCAYQAIGEPPFLKPLIQGEMATKGEGDPASDPGLCGGSPMALKFWQS